MTDTVLASTVVAGDVIKRQGRPDATVILTDDDQAGNRVLITVQEVLRYKPYDPVVIVTPRVTFH